MIELENTNNSNCEICNKSVCLMHKKFDDPEEFEACAICEKAICQECIDDNVMHEGFVCVECGERLKVIKLTSAFSPENMKMCIGSQIVINDSLFTRSLSEQMSGILATWESGKYVIYAQPNFDGIGIPIEIWYDGEFIGDDYYSYAVCSFDEYKEKVKEMSEKILEMV